MNTSKKDIPPKKLLKFFRWYCHPDYVEDLEGDLLERFERKVEINNITSAKIQFSKDVLKLFRPGIIKSIETPKHLNQYDMFKNYFKVGIRNILKYKTVSFINVLGLSVGIACSILILLYTSNEFSFDKYNENYENTYRVLHTYRSYKESENLPPASPEEFQVWGSAPVGPALQEYYPEISKVFRFTSPSSFLIQYGSELFQEDNIVFADSTAFDVFSWKMLHGDPKTSLQNPNSIVLTLSIANKYFGNEDPLGKTLIVNKDQSYIVTGIMEDVPPNSHFTFDAMVSMSTFRNMRPEIFENWGYVDVYTYFTLDKHSHIESLESRIPDFMSKKGPEWGANNPITFEPLSKAYLYSLASRQPGVVGSINNLYIFLSIAIFIVLIACINFINLSTARSMERAKEVGIRKSIGARKNSLIYQFLFESIFLTILSALLAIVLVIISIPTIESITAKSISLHQFISWELIIYFVGGIIFIGILAGSYPAWILAQLKPIKILKGTLKSSLSGSFLRKGMVTFQFGLSTTLIVGTIVIFSQLKYIQNRDLGFTSEQMLIVDFGWDEEVQNNIEFIKSELKRNPGVVGISASRAVPGNFYPNAGTQIESPKGEMIQNNPAIYEVGAEFIENYGLEIIAGRAYSDKFSSDSSEALVINEASVKLYGYTNPKEIVGKKFSQWGREGKIIGVVKNFNYESLHTEVEPLTIRFATKYDLRRLSLRIKSDDIPTTITQLNNSWATLVPQRPFLYNFLDDTFNKQYEADGRFGKVFGIFTSIAIFIACLGLFGLSKYTTEQRTKEIGIRKVLGATITSIVGLLSKDYIKLFIMAILIGSLLSSFIMQNWLENFAYRVSIGTEIFILSGVISILVAFITISGQTIKVAIKNPINSLKTE